MKTIIASFKTMLVLPSVSHTHTHMYAAGGMLLYFVLVTLALVFFNINKREMSDEEV